MIAAVLFRSRLALCCSACFVVVLGCCIVSVVDRLCSLPLPFLFRSRIGLFAGVALILLLLCFTLPLFDSACIAHRLTCTNASDCWLCSNNLLSVKVFASRPAPLDPDRTGRIVYAFGFLLLLLRFALSCCIAMHSSCCSSLSRIMLLLLCFLCSLFDPPCLAAQPVPRPRSAPRAMYRAIILVSR